MEVDKEAAVDDVEVTLLIEGIEKADCAVMNEFYDRVDRREWAIKDKEAELRPAAAVLQVNKIWNVELCFA